MANLDSVETKVTIAGKVCHFVHMTLHQVLNGHHQFTIKVDFSELDSLWMENPIKMIQMIGEEVNITMAHKVSGVTNLFAGLITNVSMSGVHGEQNYIIVSGCSPTIKLDGAPTMDSFMDLKLQNIADEAIANSGNGGEVTVKPIFNGKIDYIAQNNETCFAFLNRLSWLYGEHFYYDGTTCFFGKPSSGDTAVITYDTEMTHFDLSATLIPPQVNRFEYLTHDVNEINADTPETVDGVRGYIKVALDQSKKVYTSEASRPLDPSILTMKELDDMAKVEKYRMVSQMLTMRATTQTCKVKIAKEISVNLPASMKVALKHVETFFVTEVIHEADQDGSYHNTFVGIPSQMENIPMKPIYAPLALPQIAWVKSNADDRRKGRVKVEFQWQKKLNKTTNWIRVATPDAGSSGNVPKNRGYVFIPEEGDQVMINFENGDPNRPYVSASIFPENQSMGGGLNNAVKSIFTRSGIRIVFNDDDGQGSLHIADPSGNTWDMDGNGNIKVNAPVNMSIVVGKDMDVSVGENMKLSIGKNQSIVVGDTQELNIAQDQNIVVGETIDISSNKITEDITQDRKTSVGRKTTLTSGDVRIMSITKDVIIKSRGKALVQGAEDARISRG